MARQTHKLTEILPWIQVRAEVTTPSGTTAVVAYALMKALNVSAVTNRALLKRHKSRQWPAHNEACLGLPLSRLLWGY